MSLNATKPQSCPTCWSSRCLAGQEFAPGQRYGHDWQSGPMAAANARWKDDTTPPASFEEAVARGLFKPPAEPENTPNVETLSIAPAETLADETLCEPLTETLCAECSKAFIPARSTAKFCSPACRLKAHRRGLGKLHPHMLRHSCGYALANRGQDSRTIQDYLGHRDPRHTAHYTRTASHRFEGLWR